MRLVSTDVSDVSGTSGVVILKNDASRLPVTAPASLLLTGNHGLSSLASSLQQRWLSCDIRRPETHHPVRLQTLARREALVLLSLALPDKLDKPVLPRRERELVEKLATLRQTILLLQSATPIAMLPWHENVRTLIWVVPGTSTADVVAVLAGSQAGGTLPFDLPRYPGNLQRQSDGSFTQRENIRPAFAKGFSA